MNLATTKLVVRQQPHKMLDYKTHIYLLPVNLIIPLSVTLNFESLYPQPFHLKTFDLETNNSSINTIHKCIRFLINVLLPIFWDDTLNIDDGKHRIFPRT